MYSLTSTNAPANMFKRIASWEKALERPLGERVAETVRHFSKAMLSPLLV